MLVGGEEVAAKLRALQREHGWQLVWTSNDPDSAVDMYDEVAKDAGITFAVRAHGQVLHDLRIDVLMVLLNKLQSDYVGDYVGGKNTGSYRGVDNNVLIVL